MFRRLCLFITLSLAAGEVRSVPVMQDDGNPQLRIEVDVTGQTPRSRDQWNRVRSNNFTVAGDADSRELKTALSELEQFRSDFAAVFPRAGGRSPVSTRIIVFRDRQSLRVNRPLGDDSSSDAYFHAAPDLNYIVLRAEDKLSGDILRQYARVLMRDSLGPLPLWLETGLREYFGAYKLTRLGEDRVVKLGLDEYKGVSDKDLIPLKMLMTLDQDSFQKLDKDLQKTFLAESCILVQYLFQTRRLGAMLRMTNAIAEGRSVEQAFRDIFRLPEAAVLANLKNHIKRSKLEGWSVHLGGLTLNPEKNSIRLVWGQHAILRLPVRFDKLRSDIEALPVETLSQAAALAIQGDLQAHNGRLEEAESLLRQALRQDVTLAGAHASLGLLKTLQKNHTEAQPSLDTAITLNPSGNSLGYYYKALAIRGQAGPLSNSQLDAMESALQKAIQAAPEFVPAAEMLAETQLLNQRDLNGTVRLLLDAMNRSPGRTSLLILLARVSAAAGERSSAGWMLQRVIASGATTADQEKEARALFAELGLTNVERTAFADFEINEGGARFGAETKLFSKADIKRAAAQSKDTQVVRGLLTEVACSKGLTLHIRIGTPGADERIENVHADSSTDVEWLTDTGETVEPLKCEKLPVQLPVAITYRPKRKGLTMGAPLAVEVCRGESFDCDFGPPLRAFP